MSQNSAELDGFEITKILTNALGSNKHRGKINMNQTSDPVKQVSSADKKMLEESKPKRNILHIVAGCIGGVTLMKAIVVIAKNIGYAINPPPISTVQASNFSTVVGIAAFCGFIAGYYLITKVCKRNGFYGFLTLVGIILFGFTVYISEAVLKNLTAEQNKAIASNIKFVQLDSNVVNTNNFSIVFPTNPRRAIITQEAIDGKLETEAYQAFDELGMYAFSYGQIDTNFADEQSRKDYLSEMFKGLVASAQNAQIIDQRQSDQFPYDLTYMYTSDYKGYPMVHIGNLFFANYNDSVKVTLVCPRDSLEIGKDCYTQFLQSLELKKD